MLGRFTLGLVEGVVHRVTFRCTGQVHNRLGHGQFTLGATQALLHIPGIQAQGQGPRIGIADIFTGHAHHPAGDIQGVAATVEHACEPVQRTVWAGATHGLMQRRNLVVKGLAALIKTPTTVAQ